VQSTLSVVAEALVAILPRVARIGLLVSVSVYLANVAVAFGLVERIAGLSRLVTGPANLPDEVGTAILTTTASTTAGYSMLADLRESGYLDDEATLIAVVMNTFFGFAQHVFTYYIPVLIPILGATVGVLYVSLRAFIALAITLVGILAGSLLLSARNFDEEVQLDPDELDDEEQTPKERLLAAWDRTRPTLRRLVPRLVIVYTLVTLLVSQYDLTAITGPGASEIAGGVARDTEFNSSIPQPVRPLSHRCWATCSRRGRRWRRCCWGALSRLRCRRSNGRSRFSTASGGRSSARRSSPSTRP